VLWIDTDIITSKNCQCYSFSIQSSFLFTTILSTQRTESKMRFRKIISIALFAKSTTAFVAPSTTAFAARTSSHKMATTEPPAIKLDPAETACVMIEYQNEFATEGGALHDAVKECMQATGTLGNSRKVMDAARDAGCTIIHVPIMFEMVRKSFQCLV